MEEALFKVLSFITFIMYCSMSQQFRVEMCELLLPKWLTCSFQRKTSQAEEANGMRLQHRSTVTHTLLLSPASTRVPQDL